MPASSQLSLSQDACCGCVGTNSGGRDGSGWIVQDSRRPWETRIEREGGGEEM
jgi:hypothetical protein